MSGQEACGLLPHLKVRGIHHSQPTTIHVHARTHLMAVVIHMENEGTSKLTTPSVLCPSGNPGSHTLDATIGLDPEEATKSPRESSDTTPQNRLRQILCNLLDLESQEFRQSVLKTVNSAIEGDHGE